MTDYILVRLDGDKTTVAVALCKEFENYDGVIAAVIVRRGSDQYAGDDSYVGEFYSTPQAVERVIAS